MLLFPKGTLALYLSLSLSLALAAAASARLLERENEPSSVEQGKVTEVYGPTIFTNWEWKYACIYKINGIDQDITNPTADEVCYDEYDEESPYQRCYEEIGGKVWKAYCYNPPLPEAEAHVKKKDCVGTPAERRYGFPPVEITKAASTKFFCSATLPVKDDVCSKGKSYEEELNEGERMPDICNCLEEQEECYRAEDCP